MDLIRKLEMSRRPGVYIILNNVNYKYYIGSSINAKKRIQIHKNALIHRNHENSHLQRAYNKYGKENFTFQVILYCNKDQILLHEQVFIDKFQAVNDSFGYNKCPNANNTLGYKYTRKQIKRLSKSHKGQKAWNKGKTGIYSKETIEKMRLSRLGKSSWNLGIPRTEEEKLKMSENRKGSIAWNKGIKMPKSVGLKIAEANRKRVWKEEARQKMSKKRKGKSLSLAHCQAISNGLKGHFVRQETKEKISISLKQKLKK